VKKALGILLLALIAGITAFLIMRWQISPANDILLDRT
jgi:hypothetical protein